ncbi:Metallo-dependent phosphatase-like protein [Aspergillus lucknowensis]|uniref:Metallo-dependent phosphatase-like protein n=1 Tax=Aspergillus lucknowensis TaxID=176173 RepID=A0ABR4LNK2_9EURO
MNSHLLPYPYNRPLARHIPGLKQLAKLLYSIHTSLNPPAPASTHASPVRVVCISDTHNATPDIPDGDLLIHAGDLTKQGSYEELHSQLSWLSGLPHTHKVVIAGNHDRLLDRATRNDEFSSLNLNWGDIIYLENTSVTLTFDKSQKRNLKVYGSPLTPEYGIWAFQYPAIRDVWSRRIPDDTDIVVTHSPPALHLDAGKGGDGYLLRELQRIKPVLAVFGHAHDGYGEDTLVHDGVQRAHDSILLQASGPVAIAQMLVWMAIAVVRRILPSPRATKLVNAALAPGSRNKSSKSPIVLDI